jgi:hypothetical protein
MKQKITLFKKMSVRYFTAVILLTGLLSSYKAIAQDRIIKGKVTDTDGSGIPGVNILLKGTSTGTNSDAEGNYTITVSSQQAILVFSFVGYTTQEILVF